MEGKEPFISPPEHLFEHLYHDAIRDLQLNKAEIKDAKGTQPQTEPAGVVHDILFKQYDIVIQDVTDQLKDLQQPDPKLVFKAGLSGLRRIEAFRFILQNLLETAKRDMSVKTTLVNYRELGLVDEWSDLKTLQEETTRNSPWPSNNGTGRVLRKLLEGLRKAALTVMQLITNAMKLIPQLVALKPSIGVSGPFPTFSFQLEFEATEAIALDTFFRALMQ